MSSSTGEGGLTPKPSLRTHLEGISACLLVATAWEHAFMARLQRAVIVSLSVIPPQNNVGLHYFVIGCQVKSSITKRHCWQC